MEVQRSLNDKDKEMEEYLDSILNDPGYNTDNVSDSSDEDKKEVHEEDVNSEEDNANDSDEKTESEDMTNTENEDTADEKESSSEEDPENIKFDKEISLDDENNLDNDNNNEPDEDSLQANFGNKDSDELGIKEPKKKKKKKKKRAVKPGRLIFALVLTALIVCISILIAVGIINVVKSITGLDRADTQIVVDIPENSTADDIAKILEDNAVIDNADLFSFIAKIKGVDSTFSAGSHVLSPNMSYNDIFDELQKVYEEERETVDVTFTEGITITEAADILEKNNVCDADRFIYIFNSSSFGFDFEKEVTTSSDKYMKMEGFLFPDTYTFYVEEEPEVVAKKIYKNFANRITPDYYGRMEDLGISLEETITLASIVQKEASDTYNMKRISSVFWNRLNNSEEYPRLESDPTRKYVEEIIIPNIEVPDEEMYKAYNTYESDGLPPGPICNPGLDAIEAVLYPADTNYYFFCSNVDTGEVFYAETLEEHEANLVKANIN